MMRAFAFVDVNGSPTGGGQRREVPEGAIPLTDGLMPIDLPELIWTDGAWSRRPVLAIWETPQGIKINLDAPGLVIEVEDRGTGELLKGLGVAPERDGPHVTLPADGDFMITVRADLPWLGTTVRRVMGLGSPLVRAAAVDRARNAARARFNETVGRMRLALITDIPGQQNIYAAKEDEARAYLAALPATLAGYPLLAAEVGVTAPDAYQLAQLWLNMAALWRQVAAGTEALRMRLGAALPDAPDEAAVDAAVTQFTDALIALMTP